MATAKIIELNDDNICKICENAYAKYSCPRCNLHYCSLNCYQSEKHIKCSEDFYRDCVTEELEIDKNDEEAKAKLMEVLKRMHESNKIADDELADGDHLDSDDDEELLDIGERLQGIDLDDADKVWEKLTSDERQEFVAFLRSEDVTKLIPKWEPWWTYYNDKKVVEVGVENEYKNKCPKICDSIKKFTEITTKEPSECVKYNLINILTAYVFTCRYFNGDYFDFANEAVSCVVNLSLCLKVNQNFDSLGTATKSVEQECSNVQWIVTDAENISLMRSDLEQVLKGPNCNDKKFYVLCALSDLHKLMDKTLLGNEQDAATSSFSKQFPNSQLPATDFESKDKIKIHMKKIEYFLSYTNDCLDL